MNIIVNLQVEGLHCWTNCDLEEVSFLKHPHRHIFYICCKKKVIHSDRHIEIIILKHNILSWLKTMYFSKTINMLNFGSMSCEMIAKELASNFDLCYCSVLEDGENGAEVDDSDL